VLHAFSQVLTGGVDPLLEFAAPVREHHAL